GTRASSGSTSGRAAARRERVRSRGARLGQPGAVMGLPLVGGGVVHQIRASIRNSLWQRGECQAVVVGNWVKFANSLPPGASPLSSTTSAKSTSGATGATGASGATGATGLTIRRNAQGFNVRIGRTHFPTRSADGRTSHQI